MLEQNQPEGSLALDIDRTVVQMTLLQHANFSPDFMVVLSQLANKELVTDKDLFLALPIIEEISRRALFQYDTEFQNTAVRSRFSPIKAALKSELISIFLFLQHFSDGRYHLSELQNALRYLEPYKYEDFEKTWCENIIDSSNRFRAFGSRAWRVMNPLLSIGVTDSTFLNTLAVVTTVFLYLAWIFPCLRLLLVASAVSKHLFAPKDLAGRLSAEARFKEQMSRHRYLALHDTVWLFGRLLGCFVWPKASTGVSFGLFCFGLMESVVLRKLAITADARKMASLSSIEGVYNPLYGEFFQLACKNGAIESQRNCNFKVTVMGLYVVSLSTSLISLLFFSKTQPSAKFSWSWIGSLVGALSVLMTCAFHTFSGGGNKGLVPVTGWQKTRNEDENTILLSPRAFL